MKKLIIYFLILPFSVFSFPKLEKQKGIGFPKEKILLIEKVDNLSQVKPVIGDCRLIEEQVNGVTEIKYIYDTLNRLTEKKFLKLKYSEIYKYDSEGLLIKITNNDFNGYTIDFEYNNGLLVSKTKRINSLSIPIINTYEYNASKELVKMTETYFSTTVTEFSNGKAIKMTNPHISYQLNIKGLITSASSISGNSTVSTFKYDKNDMLVLHEIFSEPNKKIMFNEYINSNVKKSKMGSEFVDAYKGFPIFKNPMGESTYYTSSVSNYSTNTSTGLLEKVHEIKTIQTVNTSGLVMSELATINANTPATVYIYSGCGQ